MDAEYLTAVAAVLLALSLATERGVAVVKTLIPWLAQEKKNAAGEIDLKADQGRRIAVQFLAFVIAWFTAALLVDADGFLEQLTGSLNLGPEGDRLDLPVPIVGLLASGGSAFWSSVVGYTSAAKDIRVTERARTSLEYKAHARLVHGVNPADAGIDAGGHNVGGHPAGHAHMHPLLHSQPPLNALP